MKVRFVESPNLPQSEIGLVAVSGTYPEIILSLNNLGIEVVPVNSKSQLHESLKNHADVVCNHLGSKYIIVASTEPELQSALIKHGFDVMQSAADIFSPYPYETALNAARIDKKLITDPKTLDQSILNYCKDSHVEIIKVRQGYAKCSTAVVDEHSIITSDKGIAKAAKLSGLDVLLIRPGYINLPGCDYGFIGGTCGKIARDKIAFAGRIQDHPDYLKIAEFLGSRKIQPITLANCLLTDIGGILPLQY